MMIEGPLLDHIALFLSLVDQPTLLQDFGFVVISSKWLELHARTERLLVSEAGRGAALPHCGASIAQEEFCPSAGESAPAPGDHHLLLVPVCCDLDSELCQGLCHVVSVIAILQAALVYQCSCAAESCSCLYMMHCGRLFKSAAETAWLCCA